MKTLNKMLFLGLLGLFNLWLAGLLAPLTQGAATARQAFNFAYSSEQWGTAGAGSGSGSTLDFTRPTRRVLLPLLQKLGAKSMIDAPCGGMLWMAPFLREDVAPVIPGFRYLGVDVVDAIMAANKEKFAAEKTWSFDRVDLSTTVLPNGYDVLFSRDAFQHMPMEAVVKILRMMSKSDAKWLIAGSYDKGKNHRTTWGGALVLRRSAQASVQSGRQRGDDPGVRGQIVFSQPRAEDLSRLQHQGLLAQRRFRGDGSSRTRLLVAAGRTAMGPRAYARGSAGAGAAECEGPRQSQNQSCFLKLKTRLLSSLDQ